MVSKWDFVTYATLHMQWGSQWPSVGVHDLNFKCTVCTSFVQEIRGAHIESTVSALVSKPQKSCICTLSPQDLLKRNHTAFNLNMITVLKSSRGVLTIILLQILTNSHRVGNTKVVTGCCTIVVSFQYYTNPSAYHCKLKWFLKHVPLHSYK